MNKKCLVPYLVEHCQEVHGAGEALECVYALLIVQHGRLSKQAVPAQATRQAIPGWQMMFDNSLKLHIPHHPRTANNQLPCAVLVTVLAGTAAVHL